jgi:hypothetical protein
MFQFAQQQHGQKAVGKEDEEETKPFYMKLEFQLNDDSRME